MKGNRLLTRIVLMVWGICCVLLFAALLVFSGLADAAASAVLPQPSVPPTATLEPSLTQTFTRTHTPLPSGTFTPSLTFTPSIAPTVTQTSTQTEIPYASGAVIIGYSVEGRPIEVFRFGTGPAERLTVHGIHGGYEWNTIALADQLIAELTDHPDRIPEQNTLYIIRSLNPDGDARSHGPEGRANANGVDLNRNWAAYWQAQWDLTGCWAITPVTGGPYPFSEPENVALRDFILQHDFGAMIVYHSAALGVFAAGDPPHPPSVRLAKAIAGVSPYRYPPIDTGCTFTGDLSDWGALQGITAVALELLTHTDTDFTINLQVLELLLNFE